MMSQKQLIDMKATCFLAVLSLSFFTVLLISTNNVSAGNPITARNITYNWNTQTLSAGWNMDVTYLCPPMPTEEAAGMGLEDYVIRINYENETGKYRWISYAPGLSGGYGNLTHMIYGEQYDIFMDSPAIWTCPCNYKIHNENVGTNTTESYTKLNWWGGYCDLETATVGADGLYIAPCLGLTPRAGLYIYYCDDYSPDFDTCIAWRSADFTIAPNLYTVRNFTNGMELLIANPTYAYTNFSLGISCQDVVSNTFLVQAVEDKYNRPIANVKINMTHQETNSILSGVTDENGFIPFNLTLTGYYEIRGELEGYSQKLPYYGDAVYYDGTPYSKRVIMHWLIDGGQHLDVHVCAWNTTMGDVQTQWWGWGFGTSTQTGSATCKGVPNAKVIISGNTSLDAYTGDSGRSSFYDLAIDKTYWIAVNASGYCVVGPAWNSSILLTDMDYSYYRVEVTECSIIEGSSSGQPSDNAKNLNSGASGFITNINTIIPDGIKAGVWIVFEFLVSAGVAIKTQWQFGAIGIIALTLAGTIALWLPLWVGIVLIIVTGFFLAKGLSELIQR